MQYDTGTLDPARQTSITDFQEGGNIYEGLVRYKLGTTEIEPSLAESWDVAPDGKSYTFHLRQGVNFHKNFGTLDAAAVKFNVERMLDPATKSI